MLAHTICTGTGARILAALVSFVLFSLLLVACSSSRPELRSLLPAETLVYLESNDLGKVLTTIAEQRSFRESAAHVRDLSAVDGVRLAIAITGFEMKEQPVTDENSVLSFQPRFIAILDTNAWEFQATAFTENKLGEFVNQHYGGEVVLETSQKYGGKFYVWTGQDGRKAFALVDGALVYFTNDEAVMDKCMAVKRGDAPSVGTNPKIAALPADGSAAGYISPEGVKQIAGILGLYAAKQVGDEGEVQSFVGQVVPAVLQSSVTEATWTSTVAAGRITDEYRVVLEPAVARVFAEAITRSENNGAELSRFVPPEFAATTRYALADPRVAWRSVVITAQHQAGPVAGEYLVPVSAALFEPYGIDDAEGFLGAVGDVVETVKFDADGDEVAAIARTRDAEKLKLTLAKEIDLKKEPELIGNAQLWRSPEGDLAAAFVENFVIVGDAASVEKCVRAGQAGEARDLGFGDFQAPITTIGRNLDPAAALVDVLSNRKEPIVPLLENYSIETRFRTDGVERRTVSDFGLVGWIISKLATEP